MTRYGGLTPNAIEDARARFERDTAQHQMTVLHDDGVYRHIRFQSPATGIYWYELVTWPGRLTFAGDMGTWAFARLPDMFEFFTGPINPTYWGEKITAGECVAYDRDLVLTHAREIATEYDCQPALVEIERQSAFKDDLHDAAAAMRWLTEDMDKYPGFTDTWEWTLRVYTPHFLWALHGIKHGIEQYRALTAPAKNPAA